jgi:hypothetical protein
MALGWGRGQRGATRTEGGSGVVSLGGGRRQRWRTRVSIAASGRERVRACERERERDGEGETERGDFFLEGKRTRRNGKPSLNEYFYKEK